MLFLERSTRSCFTGTTDFDITLFGVNVFFFGKRLTRGRLHATDYSNVCATGFYDPYILEYAEWLMRLLGIPKNMMPEIKDTSGDWGAIHSSVFGAEIPINCVVR